MALISAAEQLAREVRQALDAIPRARPIYSPKSSFYKDYWAPRKRDEFGGCPKTGNGMRKLKPFNVL